jgi:hypothetical protein
MANVATITATSIREVSGRGGWGCEWRPRDMTTGYAERVTNIAD